MRMEQPRAYPQIAHQEGRIQEKWPEVLAARDNPFEVTRRDVLKTAGFLGFLFASGKHAEAIKLIENAVLPPAKEKESGEPKINIHIFYVAHEFTKDARAFFNEFKKAHVFIPEMEGWTRGVLGDLRSLVAGKMSLEVYIKKYVAGHEFGRFLREEAEMIYNSGKYITLVDLPAGHPLLKDGQRLELPGIDYGKSFENLISQRRTYFEVYAAFMRERENHMIARLREFMETLKQTLKENPDLFSKEEQGDGIMVLLFLGASHTRVSHTIRHKGLKDLPRRFAKWGPHYVFPMRSEVWRRNLFGREVTDTHLARGFLEELFISAYFDKLIRISGGKRWFFALSRAIVSKFNLDDIKDVFENVKKADSIPMDLIEVREELAMTRALEKKGIKPPTSIEEFGNMLPHYLRKQYLRENR